MLTQKFKDSSEQIYFCNSTDTKPNGCVNGSVLYELDTKKYYMFDEENSLWYEVPYLHICWRFFV